MTNETVKNFTFVLKDQDGNYVSANSIGYYEDTKLVIYSYCRTLTNGFMTHPTWEYAQIQLEKLNQANARFKLKKEFHIEEIDMRATAHEEFISGKIKDGFAFIHEYTEFDDGEKWIWVVKDSKGNFAHANSIKKWNSKTWMYVSFKSFSQECRGCVDQMAAERALDKIYSKSRDMGLNESFTLEYVNIDDAIKQHKVFKGENMVLIEKPVEKIAKKRSA